MLRFNKMIYKSKMTHYSYKEGGMVTSQTSNKSIKWLFV